MANLSDRAIDAFAYAMALWAIERAAQSGTPLSLEKLDLVGIEETDTWFAMCWDLRDDSDRIHKRMYQFARQLLSESKCEFCPNEGQCSQCKED